MGQDDGVPAAPVDPIAPFKDAVEADRLGVFVDMTEFGDVHLVDGVRVPCVLDATSGKVKDADSSVIQADVRLFCRCEDVERKQPGATIEVDGRLFLVLAWREDMGMVDAELAQHVGVM